MHIADVQLQQRHARAFDGIHQGNAGVGVGAGVEDQTRQFALGIQLARLMDVQSISCPSWSLW